MNAPICVTNICVSNRKHSASFSIAGLLLAIAPLWLMLAAANRSLNAQTSSTPSPADWTEFHRDNMQRWNPYETTLGVNNVGTLGLKWSYVITNPDQFSDSSPAVTNGVVYIGAEDGNVYALNASTGVKLWSYATGDKVESSPAVANGVVYVGSADQNVYALNASTGAQLWSYATGGSVTSSPAVANGVVYVGSYDGNVYALNANTGALLWSYATGGDVYSSPAVANGVVYFGSPDNNVYALNASTGAKVWSFVPSEPQGSGIPVEIQYSSPAVTDGVVYIGGGGGNIYALNASTGAMLWSYPPQNTEEIAGTSNPAVANGVVYFGESGGVNNKGIMYALNASTGAALWSFSMPLPGGFSPAVANGIVYIFSDDGYTYALNASTGHQLWRYFIGNGGTGVSGPVVVDGVLYVNSGKTLFAFGPGLDADLYQRIIPTPPSVARGDLLTYAFPVWNLGPANADYEVLNTQVPAGTTFDYVRISGTKGLGTCTTPPYGGTGEIVCHENSAMAPNTTWTVRLIVKVTAPSGTVITENATVTEDTPDPNLANNTATVSTTVQ